MTQVELNRAIARATGESLSVIAGRGFQPFEIDLTTDDYENQYIDWEELELNRNVALVEQRSLREPALV